MARKASGQIGVALLVAVFATGCWNFDDAKSACERNERCVKESGDGGSQRDGGPGTDGGHTDGGEPYRQLSPSTLSYDFGGIALQQTSEAEVTVSNYGDTGTGPLEVFIDGDSGPYEVTQDGCADKLLPPNETCTLRVRFKPIALGVFDATLHVRDPLGAEATTLLRGAGATTPAEVGLVVPPWVLLGDCAPLRVEARDAMGGDPVPVLGTVPVTLEVVGDPQKVAVYAADDETCSQDPNTAVTIESGQTGAELRFRSLVRTPVVVKGTAFIDGMNQDVAPVSITMSPQARSVPCVLPSTLTSVTCGVSPVSTPGPPLGVTPSRTLLFFQAASGEPSLGGAMIRCALEPDGMSVICDRNASGIEVNVRLWLLELPVGLRVQRKVFDCDDTGAFTTTSSASAASLHPTGLEPVDPAHSFVLVSMQGPGGKGTPSASQLRTSHIELDGGVTLTVTGTNACPNGQALAVQVVQWDDAEVTSDVLHLDPTESVKRATGPVTAGDLLLYSWRVDETPGPTLCEVSLDAVVGAQGVDFTRGCDGAGLPEVRWQAVRLPQWAKLDVVPYVDQAGVEVHAPTVPLPPDHVVFAGGQPGPGGQAFGLTQAGASGTEPSLGAAQAYFTTGHPSDAGYVLDVERGQRTGDAALQVQLLSITPQ